ncbi:MAG: hypothetical protein WCG27_08720 [Pseudomonadota bacterium]
MNLLKFNPFVIIFNDLKRDPTYDILLRINKMKIMIKKLLKSMFKIVIMWILLLGIPALWAGSEKSYPLPEISQRWAKSLFKKKTISLDLDTYNFLSQISPRVFNRLPKNGIAVYTAPIDKPMMIKLNGTDETFLYANENSTLQSWVDQVTEDILSTPDGKVIFNSIISTVYNLFADPNEATLNQALIKGIVDTGYMDQYLQHFLGTSKNKAKELRIKLWRQLKITPSVAPLSQSMASLKSLPISPKRFLFILAEKSDLPFSAWTFHNNDTAVYLQTQEMTYLNLVMILAHEMAITFDLKNRPDKKWIKYYFEAEVAGQGPNPMDEVYAALDNSMIKLSLAALRGFAFEKRILQSLQSKYQGWNMPDLYQKLNGDSAQSCQQSIQKILASNSKVIGFMNQASVMSELNYWVNGENVSAERAFDFKSANGERFQSDWEKFSKAHAPAKVAELAVVVENSYLFSCNVYNP